MLLRKLATGGVDVITARVSDGGLDTNLRESADELLGTLLCRGLEPGIFEVVELDEIHVSKGAAREVAQGFELCVVVVHAADEGVLIRRPPAGGFNVLPHDVMEALERVLFDPGHDCVSRRLDGGVQGDGERELLGFL